MFLNSCVEGNSGPWNYVRRFDAFGHIQQQYWRSSLIRLWADRGTVSVKDNEVCFMFEKAGVQCIGRVYEDRGVLFAFSDAGQFVTLFRARPVLVTQQEKIGIQVVSATYGGSCGAPPGNATDHLTAKCGGLKACDYVIDYKILGDPKSGCAKDFQAKWRCGDSSELHEVALSGETGFEQHVRLSCAAER